MSPALEVAPTCVNPLGTCLRTCYIRGGLGESRLDNPASVALAAESSRTRIWGSYEYPDCGEPHLPGGQSRQSLHERENQGRHRGPSSQGPERAAPQRHLLPCGVDGPALPRADFYL